MRRWRLAARAFVVGLATFVASPAAAQGNAYGSPIGGRSALMGNTGIALGIDGAAPFLNPATIVRLDDQRFAFSVNFYNFSVNHFSNWHQPGPVDARTFGAVHLNDTAISSGGLNGLPSTLCLFFTLAPGAPEPDTNLGNLDTWRQKLAVCLATTEAQAVSFSALPIAGLTSLGTTTQSQSLVQAWNRLNIGPSYSVAVSRRLAFGVSLHAVYTTESYLLDSSSLTSTAKNGGVQSSVGIAGQGNSLDASAILGAIYSAAPYTFGLSLTLPAVHLVGSYTGTTHDETTSLGHENATIANGKGTLSATPPIRLAIGAGAQWSRLNLEIDESLNIPSPSGFTSRLSGTTAKLDGTVLTSTPFEATFNVREVPVLDTSVGAEYFVRKDVSIVGGVSLNLTALPALAPSPSVGNLTQERQSLLDVSAGVGSYSKAGTLLFGFQFGYGWGTSVAANPYVTPNELAVVDTHSYSALFILAGTTNLKAIGHAVQHIQQSISGDDPPDKPTAPAAPAKPPEPPKDAK